ncbi:MAG: ATP synthase F0 subunit B [Oscillospiraceae bacterium]|nr:ATP synthase F0 subunit B [Oscillospiraceae bacterium]
MQLPLNISLQQILLHWMNLSILTGGLYFLLYKPVKQFMEKREAYYRDLEEQAADKLAQAEELKAQAQAKLEAADDEIHDERMRAQQAASDAAQEQLAQAEEQARHIIAKAEVEAEQSKERALRESQKEMRELAAKAAKKLAAKPGADFFDQFLDLTEGGGAHEGR